MQVALLLFFVALSSSGSSIDLKEIIDLNNPRQTPYHSPGYMLSAPIVVVATVLSDRAAAAPRPSKQDPSVFVQLRQVPCSLENVLKGNVKGPVFRYFFYALDLQHECGSAPRAALKASLHQPQPGRRYILFLIEDQGVLRPVGDVFDYSPVVLSGAHRDSDRRFRSAVGEAIAEILLTLGIGYADCFLDGEQMMLSRYHLTSKIHTVALIEPSLAHRDPRVRACACYSMADYFNPGHDACISSTLDDPNVDPTTKATIREKYSTRAKPE